MQRAEEIQAIIAAYPADCQPTAVEPFGGAGGFSGAMLWRLNSARGLLCLRRWPAEHPSAERLEWIHRVVAHVVAGGFDLLPAPIPARTGRTFVERNGDLWELTPWMPGQADYASDRRPAKLCAAMTALAQFHRSAEDFDAAANPELLKTGSGSAQLPSPGIAERLALVRRLLDGRLVELERAVSFNRDLLPILADQARTLIRLIKPQLPSLHQHLQRVSSTQVMLQPCLRDIWHDHVLFLGDCVSGIIDLGSMRMESVAADLARLLGSLCENDAEGWSLGISAYESLRPLSPAERQLLAAFDQSQILLAGVKWVEWVFVEWRVFSDPSAVVKRMEHILARLGAASGILSDDNLYG